MGDIFQGIKGNLQGYGLEDSDFDPQSDDGDIDAFFGDAVDDGVVNQKAIRKSKRIFEKTTESDIFGGF
jgi:hypothetical protein